MQRIRARDPEALEAFFDRYFDRIFGLACRMMGDRCLAEDVTQDVFFKVHRAAHRLDPDRDPGPWLTAVVCNACRGHWRGKHHKASLRSVSIDDVADWDGLHPRTTRTPETDVLEDEAAVAVRRAVADLPGPLREVLLLRDYEELSHKEIAAALGTSHDAVRKRYSRALAALGERLRGKR